LVMVGPPNFFSSTTLRPFGPSVTLTALATALTPRSRLRRASSLNTSSLAMFSPFVPWGVGVVLATCRARREPRRHPTRSLDDGVDVALAQDHDFLAAEVALGPGPT